MFYAKCLKTHDQTKGEHSGTMQWLLCFFQEVSKLISVHIALIATDQVIAIIWTSLHNSRRLKTLIDT